MKHGAPSQIMTNYLLANCVHSILLTQHYLLLVHKSRVAGPCSLSYNPTISAARRAGSGHTRLLLHHNLLPQYIEYSGD